jgi:Acetyltransferase (GNAT) domain
MTVELQIAGDDEREVWDEVVAASPHGTIFHTWKWLKIAERHLSMHLHPLMAYQGDHLVSIYPFFVHSFGIFPIADSPPSEGFMLYLGPVIVDYERMRQERRDHTVLSLQERTDDYLFSELGCKLIRVHLSPGLYDSRPFIWRGYRVKPAYTYRTPLSKGIEGIWQQFDGKLRADIRRTEKLGVRVREGGLDELLGIHDALYRRFREKGLKKRECRGYLTEIYRDFHEDNMKIFVAEYQENLIGSVVTLLYKDILRLWIGTPKSDMKGVYPNNLVQWEAIKWAATKGFSYCENMDTGDDSTRAPFKAKFNADLALWFKADKFSSNLYKLGHFFMNPRQY